MATPRTTNPVAPPAPKEANARNHNNRIARNPARNAFTQAGLAGEYPTVAPALASGEAEMDSTAVLTWLTCW